MRHKNVPKKCRSYYYYYYYYYNSDISYRFLYFVSVETGMNTLQFTYLMAWWHHNCVTSQITLVYFIELIFKIKYVEFEDRTKFFYKKPVGMWIISDRRLINKLLTKDWKRWTLEDFLWKLQITSSIERSVMIDFTVCCF